MECLSFAPLPRSIRRLNGVRGQARRLGVKQMETKSNSKWDDDDDRRLLELKAAGKSDRAIADTL
jgi:hypothetical protein